MSKGEHIPLVVGPDGLPISLPNKYILLIRRPHAQYNTLRDEACTVAYAYDWCARRGFDLDARLKSGEGLTPLEISGLFQNLRYYRAFGRKVAAEKLQDVTEAKVVCGKTHRRRVSDARRFLVWALECAAYMFDIGDSRAADIHLRASHIERKAKEYEVESSDRQDEKEGLDPERRSLLLEIMNPVSKRNPFSKVVRFRNYVLILLMLCFGFRRGENLKIYVSDVLLGGRNPRLHLVRRPDDPNDSRKDPPALKTLGRDVPLVPEMAKLLNMLINMDRVRFPGAETNVFLFLSTHGNELGLRMVNAIVTKIATIFPEFRGLTPHILRYTSNDILLETANRLGYDGVRFERIQNSLNGWQPDSHQGNAYARAAIKREADAVSIAHQRSLFA